jgi:hypothetical protein
MAAYGGKLPVRLGSGKAKQRTLAETVQSDRRHNAAAGRTARMSVVPSGNQRVRLPISCPRFRTVCLNPHYGRLLDRFFERAESSVGLFLVPHPVGPKVLPTVCERSTFCGLNLG